MNCPLTMRVFSLSVVVTKTLSADTIYIAGKSLFVILTPSSTSWIFAFSSASTLMVQFSAVPLTVYTPSSVMSMVLSSDTVILFAPLVSAVCSRSRLVKVEASVSSLLESCVTDFVASDDEDDTFSFSDVTTRSGVTMLSVVLVPQLVTDVTITAVSENAIKYVFFIITLLFDT